MENMNKQCNINFSKLQVEKMLLKEKFGELHKEIWLSSVAASTELCEKIENHVKYYLLRKTVFLWSSSKSNNKVTEIIIY